MNTLTLKITDFYLEIDLGDVNPGICEELRRDFHQFICKDHKEPDEKLFVIQQRLTGKYKADKVHEEILKGILQRPKLKFPFSNNPLKDIEKDIRNLSRYSRNPRYISFFKDLDNPENIMVYPMEKACFYIRQQNSGSALFLRNYFFRRSNAGSIWESIHLTSAMALPLHDSMLMHGVGIRREDKGYLFLGLPDSGKTTVASFSPPDDVISDDGIFLEKEDTEFFLSRAIIDQSSNKGRRYENPPEKTRLRMGFFLEKSDRNSLERILPADACSIILKNHIHYFRYFLPESVSKSFSLITDLCKNIPFYRLHFRKEPFFWTNIKEEMYNIEKQEKNNGFKK